MIMINDKLKERIECFKLVRRLKGPAGGPLSSLLHSRVDKGFRKKKKDTDLDIMRQWALSSARNDW